MEWTTVEVGPPNHSSLQDDGDSSVEEGTNVLLVSNPSVPLPSGVRFLPSVVTNDEEALLLNELENRDFTWEGFDQRRRVQRYSFVDAECTEKNDEEDEESDDDDVPGCLRDLRSRLEKLTGCRAQNVTIQEYTPEKWSWSGDYASNQTVTSFETSRQCPLHNAAESERCTCFVAQIPLKAAAIQHWNQPAKKRQASCWQLKSQDHWTDVRVPRCSALIKTGDCLFQWRSRTTAEPASTENSSVSTETRVLLLNFYSLFEDDPNPHSDGADALQQENDHTDTGDDNFGYVPSDNDRIPSPDETMPPLEDLLTIIVTTSPIKSHPSTELLERAMDTLLHAGPEFAHRCRKVIVCDGFRTRNTVPEKKKNGENAITRRHNNDKQAMRSGIVTSEQAERYRQFKEKLRELCATADDTSPFQNAVVEELQQRHGYGFALRHALRHCVSTDYVCVVQHDRTFMRPTPVVETVEAMWRHPYIKYVGLTMRSNLMYRDIFLGKYGSRHLAELDKLVLHLPELVVDAAEYGPESRSTKEMSYATDKLRRNILAMVDAYNGSCQAALHQQQSPVTSPHAGRKLHQMTLTPTLFWYDNIHICETAHYRDFIFDPSYKMVARGGFVEDKLSPVLKRAVERLGLKEGHSRFGCFLLDDHSGMFFTGHLDGGSFLTNSERKELIATQQRARARGHGHNQ